MKASQEFEVFVDEDGVMLPHKDGDELKGLKRVAVKKGGEIPDFILQDIVNKNPQFLDVPFVDKRPVLPKGLFGKEAVSVPKETKYTESELDKLSVSELKKIAEKFGKTGKSRTVLISEILKAQENK